MKEKNAMFWITILKNITASYFDTFFVLYFFEVANYDVIPLAKYYITVYLFLSIGFVLIRKFIKRNQKIDFFRIGVSFQAIYIALIMILKERIVDFVIPVAIVRGLADGIYHFPKNVMDTEKIKNEDRQKFSGMINIISNIAAILIPILLGVLLTFYSYVSISKIFFILFIIMYVITFWLKDEGKQVDKKIEWKRFFNLLKTNKNVRNGILAPLLSGFTYASGVMGVIITLSKIYNFKTSLNLGIVDGLCAVLTLLSCIVFTIVKKNKFNKIMIVSGLVSFISLILSAFFPNKITLIIYLIVRSSFINIIYQITSNVRVNLGNCDELKKDLKTEYYLITEFIYTIARCFGYTLLLLVCLLLGTKYINLVLILPAIAILLEGLIIGNLSNKTNNL